MLKGLIKPTRKQGKLFHKPGLMLKRLQREAAKEAAAIVEKAENEAYELKKMFIQRKTGCQRVRR
jgi:hypothetical protein